jgi:hypothetical protein
MLLHTLILKRSILIRPSPGPSEVNVDYTAWGYMLGEHTSIYFNLGVREVLGLYERGGGIAQILRYPITRPVFKMLDALHSRF